MVSLLLALINHIWPWCLAPAELSDASLRPLHSGATSRERFLPRKRSACTDAERATKQASGGECRSKDPSINNHSGSRTPRLFIETQVKRLVRVLTFGNAHGYLSFEACNGLDDGFSKEVVS